MTPDATPLQPARDQSLDLIRFIAMLMVICIHICAKGFFQMGERHWWALNLYESVSRIGVPLFFMVTGALLLDREHSVPSLLKRIWRVTVPLFAWSVVYLLWFRWWGVHNGAWLALILRQPVVAHFWYLYTLLGAYLFLPVMAGFFQANRLATLLFVLGAWFVGATIVPTVLALTSKEYIGINWSFLPLYAGYLVLGAVLYRKPVFRTPPFTAAVLVWLLCAIATAVLTWYRSSRLTHADETFFVYSAPFVALGGAAAFIALREACRRWLVHKPVVQRWLGPVSRLTFGVYLVHVWVIAATDALGYDYRFANPWVWVPVWIAVVFAVSATIVAVLQKVRFVRAIVPA